MNYALLLAGAVLVGVVTYDIVQTALRLGQRGGPITLRLASYSWRAALRFRVLIPVAGVAILLSVVVVWVLLLWVGWSLVYAATDGAIVSSSSGEPADLVGKFYFAGYTVFTLGNGDYVPTGAWRLLTVVTSAWGLMLVTLSITYFVPLLSAVVEKRVLAGRISILGTTTTAIVRKVTGERAAPLVHELAMLPTEILLLRERHLAYPVLHFFQTRDRGSAIAPNLAVLNEALLLVGGGTESADPGLFAAGKSISSATARLVESLEPWFLTDPPDPSDLPEVRLLDAAGLDHRSQRGFSEHADAKQREFRSRLRWMVQDTGWPGIGMSCIRRTSAVRGAPKRRLSEGTAVEAAHRPDPALAEINRLAV